MSRCATDATANTTVSLCANNKKNDRTNNLGKPRLVQLVPDVEHLLLNLLLADIISTQHASQLNSQTNILLLIKRFLAEFHNVKILTNIHQRYCFDMVLMVLGVSTKLIYAESG